MVQNESLKVLWGFNVKCDRIFEARGPDIHFMNKQAMEAKIIDIAKRKSSECDNECNLNRVNVRWFPGIGERSDSCTWQHGDSL